ncbi:hypothetical protein [Peribacillus sp. SI8-4]|uniref:hypothetical protein n=1 Tax=Peribacillus sp. SI8-4 TaxID=3048009 RepID=UPI002555CFF1|nr:hypothetical protein [Peribacillus sp. SI8-4]
MKRITYLILALILILSILLPVKSANAQERVLDTNIEFANYLDEIKDKNALLEYQDLVNESKLKIKPRSLSITQNDNLKGDFSVLNLVDVDNNDIIYQEESEESISVIQHDINQDIYTFIEANQETGDVIFIIDGIPFKIKLEEGENVNLYSESGQILPLLITEYVDFNPYSEDITQSPMARAAYGKERGPFKKTNKALVEILTVVSAGTAAASFKLKHPVLGTISGITGIVGFIGDKVYKTFYIKFWQSNKIGDSTYVKERRNYYQYNNYSSGFVKSYTTYFYSSQPY